MGKIPTCFRQDLQHPALAADLDEVELIAAAAGRWVLDQAGRQRARAPRPHALGPTCMSRPAEVWRGLLAVWCTSPAARAAYSSALLDGLYQATRAMDDADVLLLVQQFAAAAQADLSVA